MIVTVKLIATYRSFLPAGTEGNAIQLDLENGTNVESVMRTLSVPLDASSVILVNGHVPAREQVLHDGDVITAFPALAGG